MYSRDEDGLSFCIVFTTRKRSLRRLCFYTCLSVHRGWYPSMPCRSPGGMLSQHTLQVFKGGSLGPHPGEQLRGLAGWRGSSGPLPGGSPGPHLVGGGSYWNAFFFSFVLVGSGLKFEISRMANYYGLRDLIEILNYLHDNSEVTTVNARPTKVKSFLQVKIQLQYSRLTK